jgi:hypothetical protein
MRSPSLLAAGLVAAAVGLAGCGDQGTAQRCTPPPTPAATPASAGPLVAGVDRAVVPSGGAVLASLRVSGPLHYTAPCSGPVRLLVVDSADIHVDSLTPPAPKGTPCGDVTLAAGQQARYDVQWTADPTLPTGRYRLVFVLDDQPQLAVTVQLGLDLGSAGCAT